MKRANQSTTLVLASLWLIVTGCAGQTQPEIPDTLPSLDAGKARIILTREKQLAGAGSPVIFLDIGENVSPNAMLYIKGVSVKEILHRQNFAATSLTGLIGSSLFLWADPASVSPLVCGDFDTGCIKRHWRWPQKGDGGFFYGTGLIISENCITYLGQETGHHATGIRVVGWPRYHAGKRRRRGGPDLLYSLHHRYRATVGTH